MYAHSMNETQKIEALKERLNQWIANAERNRLDATTRFIQGNFPTMEYNKRISFIDGQIDAYTEALRVL